MKTKRPDVNVQYNWIWYLAVVLIAIVWWSMAFQMYHAPTAENKVSVFVEGTAKDYSLGDTLETTYDIRLVEIHTCHPDSAEFATKYSVVGLNSSNIIIVSKKVAEQTFCAESFISLVEVGLPTDGAYIQAGPIDPDNPVDVAFGIPLDNELLSKHFTIDQNEQYYLFVGGKALDEEGKMYPHTMDVINYFMGKEAPNV